MKQLEKMGQMKELEREQDLGFSFNYQEFHGKTLMTVENLAFSWDGDPDKDLFRGLSFMVGAVWGGALAEPQI
jgi:hypothetical protein